MKVTRKELKKMHPDLKVLIDALWSQQPKLFSELVNDGALGGEYTFARNTFADTARYGIALGYNHEVYSNFATILGGHSTVARSYRETLLGSYPEDVAGTPDTWEPTDRLLAVGNGTSEAARSDALRIYKSGYTTLSNALQIGQFSWGLNNPEEGVLSFDPTNGLRNYYQSAWLKLGVHTTAINWDAASGNITLTQNRELDDLVVNLDGRYSLLGHTHSQLHDPVTLSTDDPAILSLTGQDLSFVSANLAKLDAANTFVRNQSISDNGSNSVLNINAISGKASAVFLSADNGSNSFEIQTNSYQTYLSTSPSINLRTNGYISFRKLTDNSLFLSVNSATGNLDLIGNYQLSGTNLLLSSLKSGSIGPAGTFLKSTGSTTIPEWASLSTTDLSDYSPTKLLNDIKVVDGPGSGLNADLLGGVFYTDYTTRVNVKRESLKSGGVYSDVDFDLQTFGDFGLAKPLSSNKPPIDAYFWHETLKQYPGGYQSSGSADLLQKVFPFRGVGNIYYRNFNATTSTWEAWRQVYDSGNSNLPTVDWTSDILTANSLQFVDATTSITKDTSANLTFTDAVIGTKTLAELAAGNSYTAGTGIKLTGNEIGMDILVLASQANPTTSYHMPIQNDGGIPYRISLSQLKSLIDTTDSYGYWVMNVDNVSYLIHPHYTVGISGTGGINVSCDASRNVTIDGSAISGGSSYWTSGTYGISYTSGNIAVGTSAQSGYSIYATGAIKGSELYRGSSRELKYDIQAYTGNALDMLRQTSICTYKLKENGSFGIGFIAEDTHPWLSGEQQKEHIFGNHLGLLTKAIQEEDDEIQQLKQRVYKLENELKQLRNER